jgi:hypothetical protein
MTHDMIQCADDIQECWRESDRALEQGDTEGANAAFTHAFEVVDSFPALQEEDIRALRFLCILTWVKVSAALETTGQEAESDEARRQIFALVDEMLGPTAQGIGAPWISLDFTKGLESKESADLVGRLYLLCNRSGRKDTLLWGRCFMDIDLKVQGNGMAKVN